MIAVVIVRLFLPLGLLTPLINRAITIQQSTGHVQLKTPHGICFCCCSLFSYCQYELMAVNWR